MKLINNFTQFLNTKPISYNTFLPNFEHKIYNPKIIWSILLSHTHNPQIIVPKFGCEIHKQLNPKLISYNIFYPILKAKSTIFKHLFPLFYPIQLAYKQLYLVSDMKLINNFTRFWTQNPQIILLEFEHKIYNPKIIWSIFLSHIHNPQKIVPKFGCETHKQLYLVLNAGPITSLSGFQYKIR